MILHYPLYNIHTNMFELLIYINLLIMMLFLYNHYLQ